MFDLRLGDVIDDFCVKCRRVTNHSIVSILNGEAAKVRCRTCYHDHDYRHEQAPPSKKELKKAELMNQVLSGAAVGDPSGAAPGAAPAADPAPDPEVPVPAEVPPPETKKGRKTARK